MERLRKADGHINSAERKLGFRKVERGIWSAVQAKARFAEAWLWLDEAGVELPPLERYLARNVVRERLEAFQRAPKSDLMVTAWEEAEAAEQAVREVELPALTGYRPIVDRTLLEESISRKHRFIDALHGIRRVVEDVVAKRFLNLRRGDWVRLENGDIGRVQRLEGLTVRVFVPAPYPRLRHWYGLLLERVEPPTVEAPEEGWRGRACFVLTTIRRLPAHRTPPTFALLSKCVWDETRGTWNVGTFLSETAPSIFPFPKTANTSFRRCSNGCKRSQGESSPSRSNWTMKVL